MITLKNIVPSNIRKLVRTIKLDLFDGYSTKSYSQEGEDMILQRIFYPRDEGFYIDVGAHHPKRFSNTYLFYKRGWSGINIDAMPGSMTLFKKIRPRDLNIEIAIAKDEKEIDFFIFDESPALNTCDEEVGLSRSGDQTVRRQKVLTKTLKQVLVEYLPEDTKISFLSIDVEGLDLEVLQSNDWQIFRPEYILVESLNFKSLSEIKDNEICEFLKCQKYTLIAKTVNTLIFEDFYIHH